MPEINTKYFGMISYTEEEVLHFTEGLFGFENEQEFLLIRFVNEASSMLCLQSIAEEALAFVVINPFYFMPTYSPMLSSEDLEGLQAEDANDLLYYVICTMQEDMAKSAANFKCPIVVNSTCKNKAKQVILDDSDYSFKHLFSSFKVEEGAL